MKNRKERYGQGFLFSFVVHGVLILLLIFSIQPGVNQHSVPAAKGEIVQATVVDDKLVEAEVKRLETQENQQKEEVQKAIHAKQEREKEQAKLNQLKKELAVAKREEEARLAEIKLAKEKERKQLETLRQEKEKEQKRLAALDERRQEEQDRAAQLRLEREKEEKKQQELEARRKSEETKKMAAQKAADTERLAAQRRSFLNSELARYQGLFRDKVNQAWIRAPGLPPGLVCMLEIRLLPDGTVAGVQVVSTSGNLAFDQSAEAAVQKASPLPVPEEPELMEKFRHFTFEFKPPEAV